jgi:hypothetical protein
LGGKKGLESLIQESSNFSSANFSFQTFFEVDFNFVRRIAPGTGYNRFNHGSQTVDGFLVEAQPFEMKSNAGITDWNYYTVSPNEHQRLFYNFTRNAAKTKIDGFNFSISSAGTNLLADYHRRRPVNLHQSRNILVDNLTDFTNAKGRIIVDGGNVYTLPFAEYIMNIPIACSSHVNTDASIPFMQLVLHGFMSYSGPAINMFFDPELALLKSIEFGAAPSFVLAHNEIAELKDTPYAVFYSVDYHAWYPIMVDMYHRYAEVYRGLANVPMERHDRLTEGVYKTTFSNGTRILVNYNLHDVSVALSNDLPDELPINITSRSFEVIKHD